MKPYLCDLGVLVTDGLHSNGSLRPKDCRCQDARAIAGQSHYDMVDDGRIGRRVFHHGGVSDGGVFGGRVVGSVILVSLF